MASASPRRRELLRLIGVPVCLITLLAPCVRAQVAPVAAADAGALAQYDANRNGRAYGGQSLGQALMAAVDALAKSLAAKSPLTVRGVKQNLLYSRDHTVAEGLEYAAGWNAAMLISEDIQEAVSAYLQKRKPTFAD